MPSDSGFSRVQMCMREELNQTKNGFFSSTARPMSSVVAAEEFLVNCFHPLVGEGPGIFTLLLAPGAEAWIGAGRVGRGGPHLRTPRGPNFALKAGLFG